MVMSDIKKSDKEKSTVIDEIVAEEKKKYTELNKECCSCSKSKTSVFQEEEAEAQIQFEDYIHNNVFQKNPNQAQRSNQNESDLQYFIKPTTTSIWDLSTEFFNDTFTSPSRRLSSTSTTTAATTTTEDTTNITSSPSPFEEGHFQYIVYNATFFAVKHLHHFTEYRIEVKACHDKPSEKPVLIDYDQCSSQAITTVRTHPL
ncbi:Insulin receptor, partial [Stegodyphus mimosarum]